MTLKKETINNSIGYLILIFPMLFYILQTSIITYDVKQYFLFAMVIGLSMFKLIFKREYTVNFLLVMSLFLAISLFSAYFSHDLTPVVFFILLFSVNDLSFDDISKISFIILISVLILLTMLSKLGIVPDYQYLVNGQVRHSLGTQQPTIFSALTFFCIAAFMYWRRNTLKLYHYMVVLIVIILVNHYTQAKNDTFSMLLLLLTPLLIKMMNIRFIGWALKLFLALSFLINSLFVFVASYLYSFNKGCYLGFNLDSILNNRLYLSNIAIKMYPVSLFGQQVVQHGNGRGIRYIDPTQYFFIDSSYLYVLLKYGLIFFALIILWYTWLNFQLIKKKLYFLVIILSIISYESAWQLTLLTYIDFSVLFLPIALSKTRTDWKIDLNSKKHKKARVISQ